MSYCKWNLYYIILYNVRPSCHACNLTQHRHGIIWSLLIVCLTYSDSLVFLQNLYRQMLIVKLKYVLELEIDDKTTHIYYIIWERELTWHVYIQLGIPIIKAFQILHTYMCSVHVCMYIGQIDLAATVHLCTYLFIYSQICRLVFFLMCVCFFNFIFRREATSTDAFFPSICYES